jgi:uncharacterized membrane protein
VVNLRHQLYVWHRITQVSFLLTIVLLFFWAALWFPPHKGSGYWLGLIWITPLLFALRGVFKSDLYTYAWLQFVNMIYFCHAIMYLMSSDAEIWVASAELLLVLTNFTSAIICIRINKKLGQ